MTCTSLATIRNEPAGVALVGLLLRDVDLVLRLSPSKTGALLWLAALVLAADIIGLPREVSDRFGLGRHSQEWLLDSSLIESLQPINDQLSREPSDSTKDGRDSWRAETVRIADRQLNKALKLHAPSQDWDELRLAYVRAYRMIVDAISYGDGETLRNATAHLNTDIERDL